VWCGDVRAEARTYLRNKDHLSSCEKEGAMNRSQHSLHAHVALQNGHKAAMDEHLAGLRKDAETSIPQAEAEFRAFPISTVSTSVDFDAYILVGFEGASPSWDNHLIVDSGNTSLIVPRWEDIAAIQNYQASYQVLGQVTEPWGCPANVVKGPIELYDSAGAVFTVDDCVFLACTGDSPKGGRTANFGAGCIEPWSACGKNVLAGLGITLQPVLSRTGYPYVEFDYAMQTNAGSSVRSAIRIHRELPEGFRMFEVLRDCQWMALTPAGLSIAGVATAWPGSLKSPIAMIDTGGGPVHLSDPDDYLLSKDWPDPVADPAWASGATVAKSIQAPLEITLCDGMRSYSYVVDNSWFPAADQGLTLVICQQNPFMMGEQGMNVGGISALANAILIDYKGKRVGFRKRSISAL
jgi:hypothetical protein